MSARICSPHEEAAASTASEVTSFTSSVASFELPPCFRLLSVQQVLLCVEHGCCYTVDNAERHLRDQHQLPRSTRQPILQHLRGAGLASGRDAVTAYPQDGTPAIPGLPIHQGYCCRTLECGFKTVSQEMMRRHCSKVHGQRSPRGQPRPPTRGLASAAPPSYWKAVQLQTLWAENRLMRYFVVASPADTAAVGGEGELPEPEPEPEPKVDGECEEGGDASSGRSLLPGLPGPSGALRHRFQAAQAEAATGYRSLARLGHKSETSPWLRDTGYHAHLAQVDPTALSAAYALPSADGPDELWLHTICQHAKVMLRRAMRLIVADGGARRRGQKLNRLNARLLNTFRRAETSQDPIRPLQESRSRDKYIRTWLQLLCYFYRAREGRDVPRDLFVPTRDQLHWAAKLREAAHAVLARRPPSMGPSEGAEQVAEPLRAPRVGARTQARGGSRGGAESEVEEEAETEAETEAEGATEEGAAGKVEAPMSEEAEEVVDAALHLSVSLMQQELPHSPFDSAIISFTAALAWDPQRETWRPANTVTSYLSQLIYDCQVITFRHCVLYCDFGRCSNLRQELLRQRDQWLLNDTCGPVAEMLASRLLGFGVARTTVNQAQVRWHQDGQTVVYNDLKLRLADIPRLVAEELRAARTLLGQDLCFALPGVPVYSAADLVDNWDSARPGASFLTDPRNQSRLADGEGWLFRQMCTLPALADSALQSSPDGSGERFRVRSGFAKQYEQSVQRFLEHLLVLMHVGSGQAARRPEFLGLRWCNNAKDKRNLFVHDGYMLFILTYHKALNVTSASRWPVRFLLPAVGELLLQYLVLVQPLRIWLAKEVQIPPSVSAYLWSSGESVWTPDKMTRVLRARTRASIGVGVNVQSWRQLSVGIAIKKFAGMGCQLDLDLPGEGDAVEEGGAGAGGALTHDVFHFQASHTPRTGNQMYGGSVNFQQGLTDAGLQEYLWASQLWHKLCQGVAPSGPGKHRREPSGASGDPMVSVEMPLLKRLACREAPSRRRWRRRWTLAEAEEGLRKLCGAGATFRGERQRAAIEAVLAGAPEVVVVLGTGEGKSLLYLLPCRLPGAGTTVVILPLVALRHDMQRRCDAAGMPYRVWQERDDGDGGAEGVLEGPPDSGHTLIFVSVEAAVRGPFLKFANALDAGRALDRIVFDECHLVLTSASYRQDMLLIHRLRMLRTQFVFLSATLPPSVMEAFGARVLLKDAHIVRGQTLRTNLRHSVQRCPPGPFAHSVRLIQALWRDCSLLGTSADAQAPSGLCSGGAWPQETAKIDEAARCIIYTATRGEADRLARELNCLRYYSDSGTEEEKAAALREWLAGDSETSRMLVATSAFGLGIDYPSVRLVLHYGAPRNAIDFAQECGRGGRDGAGASSVVLLPAVGPMASPEGAGLEPPPGAVAAMWDFLTAEGCRLSPLGCFLDGADPASRCREPGGACDRCRRRFDTAARHPPAPAPPAKGGRSDGPAGAITTEPGPDWGSESELEGSEREEWERQGTAADAMLASGPGAVTGTVMEVGLEMTPEEETEVWAEAGSDVVAEGESDSPSDPDPDLDSGSGSDADSSGMQGGGLRLRAQVRAEERSLQTYEQLLEALHGVCMICRLAGWDPPPGSGAGSELTEEDPDDSARSVVHSFAACRNKDKWRFTSSKEATMSRARQPGHRLPSGDRRHQGWLAPYSACFSCGNPQAVCPGRGRGLCEHKDIVMPICWAAYQRPWWRSRRLPVIAAELGRRRDFADEMDYMLWLGEARRRYGVQASVMMAVAEEIMQEMLSAPG